MHQMVAANAARMRKSRMLAVALSLLVLIMDQAIKFIVLVPLSLESKRQIEILPFFDLTFMPNYGISGGLLSAETPLQQLLLAAFTATIIGAVIWWMWTEKLRGDMLALALVLGGAIGNLIDRVRLGYVVDYADLHIGDFRPFLIFNLADAAITLGVLILIARALLLRKKDADEPEPAVQAGDSDRPA